MNEEQEIIDAFATIERNHAALYSLAAASSEEAKAAIAARYKALHTDQLKEYQCSLKTEWEQVVFQSLLKRYGIKAYRYRKQRRTTVLIRVSEPFMNDLLWPIFRDVMFKVRIRFSEVLRGFLPSIAAGPFTTAIIDHDHPTNELCEDCLRRLAEQI
jgi:hypothetical protein